MTPKFIKEVEAYQWTPGCHIKDVRSLTAEIYTSRDQGFYYITKGGFLSSAWLSIKEYSKQNLSETLFKFDNYSRVVLPFTFFKLNFGSSKQISEEDQLFKDYETQQNWPHLPPQQAILQSKYLVNPTDWILIDDDETKSVCTNDCFKRWFRKKV